MEKPTDTKDLTKCFTSELSVDSFIGLFQYTSEVKNQVLYQKSDKTEEELPI